MKRDFIGFILIICAFVAFAAIVLHRLFDPYDDFAKNLTIPEGVEYHEPLTAQPQEGSEKQIFTLYNGGQPGIYGYELYFAPTEQGYIYLKAYEVTTNQQLSSAKLKKRSRIDISERSNKQEKFAGEFTIYEGNMGEYYLARFEVWFATLDGGSQSKLFEETYKIEGWHR